MIRLFLVLLVTAAISQSVFAALTSDVGGSCGTDYDCYTNVTLVGTTDLVVSIDEGDLTLNEECLAGLSEACVEATMESFRQEAVEAMKQQVEDWFTNNQTFSAGCSSCTYKCVSAVPQTSFWFEDNTITNLSAQRICLDENGEPQAQVDLEGEPIMIGPCTVTFAWYFSAKFNDAGKCATESYDCGGSR